MPKARTPLLDRLARRAPDPLDLAEPEHQESVRQMAEELEAAHVTASALHALEQELLRSPEPAATALRLALKLAASRRALQEIAPPVHLSIVFAVYNEHVRILERSEHELGEDFLRCKLAQLRWLFGPCPQHSWDLTIVDDGCPRGSGRLAQAILDARPPSGEEVRVLFLDEAIRQRLPVAGSLASTDESQKGGSIRFGLWHATRTLRGDRHVALFTDADLSTHLGQAGLLVDPLARSSCNAALGSRREPASVVAKAPGRDVRGKLFIYLWKRVLPQLRGIIDTQCGFKAFRASQLRSWIEEARENGFAFDIEFLMRVYLAQPGSIVKVPIAWIDSPRASTTSELNPYLPMLRSAVALARRHLPADARAKPFIDFIESLDDDAFQRLLEAIPEEIAAREPLEFEAFDGVSVEELARISAG